MQKLIKLKDGSYIHVDNVTYIEKVCEQRRVKNSIYLAVHFVGGESLYVHFPTGGEMEGQLKEIVSIIGILNP